MAFSKLKVTEINDVSNIDVQKSDAEMYTALTENDSDGVYGCYFDMQERDDKYLLVVHNTNPSSAITITVKAGNGMGGSVDLISKSIGGNNKAPFTIESGRFKWMSNNDGYIDVNKTIRHGVSDLSEKGKVFITASGSGASIAVIRVAV